MILYTEMTLPIIQVLNFHQDEYFWKYKMSAATLKQWTADESFDFNIRLLRKTSRETESELQTSERR